MKFKPALPLGVIRDVALIIRLLKRIKVDPDTSCWIWQGFKDKKGYGQIKWKGRAHWVHRITYAIFRGSIPEGMTVDHHDEDKGCGNASCCNPEHLELATVSENSLERIRRYQDARNQSQERSSSAAGSLPPTDASGGSAGEQERAGPSVSRAMYDPV